MTLINGMVVPLKVIVAASLPVPHLRKVAEQLAFLPE
jgi:hypothetical protein